MTILSLIAPCIKFASGYARVEILRAVQAIDRKRGLEVINCAKFFINGVTQGWRLVEIFRAIQVIEPEQQLDVIKCAKLFCDDNSREKRLVEIFQAIQAIHPKQRMEVIKTVQCFCHEKNLVSRVEILQAISTIDPKQIADVIKLAEPIYRGITNEELISEILKITYLIPRESCNDMAKEILGKYFSRYGDFKNQTIVLNWRHPTASTSINCFEGDK